MKGKRLLAGLITLTLIITDLNIVKATEMETMGVPTASNEVVDATGVTEYTSSDGKFKFTLDTQYNCYATITAYLGNESDVTVQPTITCSTGTYEVKAIGDSTFEDNNTVTSITLKEGIVNIGQAFCGCPNLQTVNLPSTTSFVPDEAFNESYKLEAINVTSGGKRYFSRNGVLFYNKDNEIFLETYPEGKTEISYTIDKDIAGIKPQAFLYTQYLQNVSLPSTIKYVLMHSFDTPQNALTIYFNPETLDIINNNGNFAGEAFYGLPSSSKIIVKNATMANEIPNHMSNCTGTTVVDLSQDISYQKPVTAFTFSNGSITKDKTLGVGDIDESLLSAYKVEPADTTDNVTWTSSDNNVATVEKTTGRIEAKATGDCIITGSIGSSTNQHSITLNLKVYKAITDMHFYYPNTNQLNLVYGQNGNTTKINVMVSPFDANNCKNIVWDSSNPSIATVQSCTGAQASDQYYIGYANITEKAVGQTTITATIIDNVNILTKSFVLTVTKPKVDISAVTAIIEPQTYNGTALTPKPIVTHGSAILQEDTHYKVTYDNSSNNVNAGTATAIITGIGDYFGTKPIKFTIRKADIDTSSIVWTDTARNYTGRNHLVSLQNLPTGVSATYTNNKKKVPGKHIATATLSYDTLNYNKPKTTTFSTNWFIRRDQNINFSNNKVLGSTIKVPYGTGDFNLGSNAQTKISYSVGNSKVATVDGGGKISIKGTGFTTITVTAKKTDTYNKKTVTLNLYVIPKQSAITSLKSNKKSEMTVNWNKDKRATGYQVQYSASNKFKGNTTNTVLVDKNITTSQKMKCLSKGKKYYVRVRAYKTVNENGISVRKYGKWSSAQIVTVRKK